MIHGRQKTKTFNLTASEIDNIEKNLEAGIDVSQKQRKQIINAVLMAARDLPLDFERYCLLRQVSNGTFNRKSKEIKNVQ